MNYEQLAKTLSALANPTRLRILEVLVTACACSGLGKCCVTDIHTTLELPQPVISKHLKVLKDHNILSYEREANKIYYSFSKDSLIKELGKYLTIISKCC